MKLSPIVIVPKKNGKVRVCVDYRKLNVAKITDALSCLSAPDRCVSQVGTAEVLD